MYLVDTDWLIQVFSNQRRYIEELNRLAPSGTSVSVITMAELCEGVRRSRDPIQARTSVEQLKRHMPVMGIDIDTAEQFAVLRSDLRHQGLLIPDMDLFIAATALRYNLTLCTQNVRHFSRIPKLSLFSLKPEQP